MNLKSKNKNNIKYLKHTHIKYTQNTKNIILVHHNFLVQE